MDFSANEIAAVELSLRVAFWAMLGSLPFSMVLLAQSLSRRLCGD